MDKITTTYNARHLDPREVAKTFIWSTSFSKLIQNNHSVVLGARGCGKTTLMKMLTLPALYEWESKNSEEIKNTIPFYAVYISTDIYWDVKNQTYGEQLKRFGKFSELISIFSVNSNVFSSLCDTFLNIINIELQDQDEHKEVKLCKELITSWKLNNTVPKLQFVKESLNRRIDEVNQIIQHVIFNNQNDDELPNPDYFYLDFESSIEHIIPVFERIYSLKSLKKWALCFDELEFAPIWLQKKLFKSLRSRKQFILYKLSSSPILPSMLEQTLTSEYGATVGNDLQLIKMWNSSDIDEFTKKIIYSEFSDNVDLKHIFGTNKLLNKTSDSYLKGSEFYKITVDLINRDDSFKNFLQEKRIDIKNPTPLSNYEKNTLYRKIKPIVYFRNTFIDSNFHGDKIGYRSRKNYGELYSGIEVLTKICDGNPRWIKGLINQLKLYGDEMGNPNVQWKEIEATSKRFSNVIANTPVGKNNISIMQLIDKIGTYFKIQLLGKDFNMDPYGTFKVDDSKSEIDEGIIDLLERGIAQGAFILLDCDDDSFDFKVRGKKFKLSFLFAAKYHLPLRRYPEVNLSVCLKGSDRFQQTIKFEE